MERVVKMTDWKQEERGIPFDPDERIIAQYFARNEEAITATEERYGRYCRKIASNILADGRDTEECLSDTWLKAWNTIPPESRGLCRQNREEHGDLDLPGRRVRKARGKPLRRGARRARGLRRFPGRPDRGAGEPDRAHGGDQ